MGTFWQSLRYTLRVLAKSPVFTTVAILSLALGIGTNTAIFALINALLLRDLPVRQPERLVELTAVRTEDKVPSPTRCSAKSNATLVRFVDRRVCDRGSVWSSLQ